MIRAYLSGNPVHDRVIKAFAEGCGADLVDGWKWKPADVAIVFGIKKARVPISWPRGAIIDAQHKHGGRVLILETGYVRRGDAEDSYYAAGWGGLNGRADFRNRGCDGSRWELLGTPLRPWRASRGPVVVCGQIPWDAAVAMHDHVGWCQSTVATLGKAGHRVVFRPHPLAGAVNYGVRGAEVSTRPLSEDLDEASCIVTFNSNTAVDAVIAGVPAVSMDLGSMAWPVTEHALDRVSEMPRPDRRQWANEIAWAQFTPAEMRAGIAWRHLAAPLPKDGKGPEGGF